MPLKRKHTPRMHVTRQPNPKQIRTQSLKRIKEKSLAKEARKRHRNAADDSARVRRVPVLRTRKEITWLPLDEEEDEIEGSSDPWLNPECGCIIQHQYWNGCASANKTPGGQSQRSRCYCYQDRGNHTDACNDVYDALKPLVHDNREDWLAAQ